MCHTVYSVTQAIGAMILATSGLWHFFDITRDPAMSAAGESGHAAAKEVFGF
jgi:hypothetical protein